MVNYFARQALATLAAGLQIAVPIELELTKFLLTVT
jgi:hypothetical protein